MVFLDGGLIAYQYFGTLTPGARACIGNGSVLQCAFADTLVGHVVPITILAAIGRLVSKCRRIVEGTFNVEPFIGSDNSIDRSVETPYGIETGSSRHLPEDIIGIGRFFTCQCGTSPVVRFARIYARSSLVEILESIADVCHPVILLLSVKAGTDGHPFHNLGFQIGTEIDFLRT